MNVCKMVNPASQSWRGCLLHRRLRNMQVWWRGDALDDGVRRVREVGGWAVRAAALVFVDQYADLSVDGPLELADRLKAVLVTVLGNHMRAASAVGEGALAGGQSADEANTVLAKAVLLRLELFAADRTEVCLRHGRYRSITYA